ncbi:Uncharacterized protein PECH_001294 [Penicillium ucsense]|uniref:Chromatin remodeling complex subunit n=1 Tax=Penicillium ucsense TaxID=2839758 RepID=A0A8J8VXB1_9EURO|nr:Uncharacterized protein PECM_001042 [Penicillium ucsense]KAF7732985.1 Uncharacterized protein PECH_001294 [Penicillium ucsense]
MSGKRRRKMPKRAAKKVPLRTPSSEEPDTTPSKTSPRKGRLVCARSYPNRKPKNMPPFKDEHIMLIAPGSHMTLAQLGLPESFTPARFRFPTRMFPAQKKGEFEPYRIRERHHTVKPSNGHRAPEDAPAKSDTEMKDAAPAAEGTAAIKSETSKSAEDSADATADGVEKTEVQETFYEEDVASDEGAVCPIQDGRIVDWPCFFALLTHIYNALSPPFHTPILLVSQPVWTARDKEIITQFFFEKFKTPGFNIMDSALATCYGYGVQTATVIDVGKTKVDVTAVTDCAVIPYGRGIALKGCGGDAMTDRLVELLGPRGFTREMCEQLKRSNIAEILAPGTPLPGAAVTAHQGPNPAAAASTGGSGATDAVPRGPGENTQTGTENGPDDDEGVLDVAAIVSGNTTEYLAKIEKEKIGKKGGVDSKQKNAPNHQKEKASFQYEEFSPLDDDGAPVAGPRRYIRHAREIEVGAERFLLATPLQGASRLSSGILEDIAYQIYYTIQSVPDATRRSELWDSLIIVGCGSRVRGFAQALLGVITQKYLLSPSATIFTSEIPSAFSTPLPTGGTNTPAPMGQQASPMYLPAAHGVNPLLVAATHNNPGMAAVTPGTPAMDPSMSLHRSSGHSQTPTSVKCLRLPDYFPDFKHDGNRNAPGASQGPSGTQGGHGAEEATFLGAQMGAKVCYVLDQGLSKSFMTRVEYNESGPSAIHDFGF